MGRRSPTAALLAIVLGVVGAPPVDVSAAAVADGVDLRASISVGADPPQALPLEATDALGFTFVDLADPRYLVQAINGCGLNDRFWLVAANLTDEPATLRLAVGDAPMGVPIRLPELGSDGAVDPVVSLSALPICAAFEEAGGGITPLDGTARLSAVGRGCDDVTRTVRLIPRTRDAGFREVILGGDPPRFVNSSEPVAVIDDSGPERSLLLFAESRLPGRVEGVAFSGGARLLPGRRVLDRRLRAITDGRVRRAFEAAANGTRPRPLIEELGLRGVDCVHHVDLDFSDADASDRLFAAGWLKEDPDVVAPEPGSETPPDESTSDAVPAGPPADAPDDRFVVEIIDAEGRLDEIPRFAGPSARRSAIATWTFQDDDALAQVIDACDLTASYWFLLGSRAESGFEATVIDLLVRGSDSYRVAQAVGGSLAPAIVDPAALHTCE